MKIILAPKYELAKEYAESHKVDATVEAEYGDDVVEGEQVTLAHHGPRSGNPAPCNTPDVPVLKDDATILVSHVDLDTLGGIYALQGIKTPDDKFWEAAEMIDVNGTHHIHELDQDIQDKLNAYYAYNQTQPRERYTETVDVTDKVNKTFKALNSIIDINDPAHEEFIQAGKEWEKKTTKDVEDCLIYEDKNIRVFDSNGPFCAASYYSPNQETIIPATITYNEKNRAITLAFENGGKDLNAREIVQSLWGEEAGGREGIAGSPRGQEMTMDDAIKLAKIVAEKELYIHRIKNLENEADKAKEKFKEESSQGSPSIFYRDIMREKEINLNNAKDTSIPSVFSDFEYDTLFDENLENFKKLNDYPYTCDGYNKNNISVIFTEYDDSIYLTAATIDGKSLINTFEEYFKDKHGFLEQIMPRDSEPYKYLLNEINKREVENYKDNIEKNINRALNKDKDLEVETYLDIDFVDKLNDNCMKDNLKEARMDAEKKAEMQMDKNSAYIGKSEKTEIANDEVTLER